jgi:hypothetical protein
MEETSGDWWLVGATTNKHGATHFVLTQQHRDEANIDELIRVLKDRFNATSDGELVGPYSIHRYMLVDGVRLIIITDDEPIWVVLGVMEANQIDEASTLVVRLLRALNLSNT